MQLNFNKRTTKPVQEFVARINSFEQKHDQIYYKILVISQCEGNVQITHKRYSDLKKMHERLTSLCEMCKLQIQLPQFPKRKFFGKTNTNHGSIQTRMLELTQYLNSLLQLDRVYDFPIVNQMLPTEEKVDNYLLSLIPQFASGSMNDDEQDEYGREKCWNEMDELKQQFIDKQDLKTQQSANGTRQHYIFDIEDYDTLEESVVYTIVIRDVKKHDRWIHRSRYSDLCILHQALKTEGLECTLPDFPKRKIFTITNENQGLIESRKQQLVVYLNQLFAITEVLMSDSTRRFSRKEQIHEDQKLLQKIKKNYIEGPAHQQHRREQQLKLSLIQEDDKETDATLSFIKVSSDDS